MDRLRIALARLSGTNVDRPWEWRGGYPQHVFAVGSVVEVAEVFENPDFPSSLAEFIAACDPPTIRMLLEKADG
jgi:hypothetical protein